MLSLEKADRYLKIFMFFLYIPIAGIFWCKPEPSDLLSYMSFVFTVSGAVYAGRGVFNSLEDPKNQSSQQEYFFTSLVFILGAALCLVPVLYKKCPVVLTVCILLLLVIFTVSSILAIHKGYLSDNKHPFFRGLLPITLIGFNVVVFIYVISHYDLLTK